MTSELIPFIENAIEQQGWPYKVSADEAVIVLELQTNNSAYLERNHVVEAFKIRVRLENKKGKLLAYVTEEIFDLIKNADGSLEIGAPIERTDSAGAQESDSVTAEDGWKLFMARRWLVSILQFKGYSVKEPAKTRSRVTVTITSVVAVFILLAFALGGIANSMTNGAITGNEVVKTDNNSVSKTDVLHGFFK